MQIGPKSIKNFLEIRLNVASEITYFQILYIQESQSLNRVKKQHDQDRHLSL